MIWVDYVGGNFNKEGNGQDTDNNFSPKRSLRYYIWVVFSETVIGQGNENHIKPEKEEENNSACGVKGIIHLSSIDSVYSKLEEDLSDAGHPDNPGRNLDLTIGKLVGVGGQNIVSSLPEELHQDTRRRKDKSEQDILGIICSCLGDRAVGERFHFAFGDSHIVAGKADNQHQRGHIFSDRGYSEPIQQIIGQIGRAHV